MTMTSGTIALSQPFDRPRLLARHTDGLRVYAIGVTTVLRRKAAVVYMDGHNLLLPQFVKMANENWEINEALLAELKEITQCT